MKYLALLLIVFVGCNFVYGQDSLNNRKDIIKIGEGKGRKGAVIYYPGIYNDNELQEMVVVKENGKVLWSELRTIKTCAEFIWFRKDYPMFEIPAHILARFKHCK